MEQDVDDQFLKLNEAIKDPEFRDAVERDLDDTLSRHGVDKAAILQPILDTLTTLTSQELAVLLKVKGALDSAGVSEHVKAEWV